MSPVARSVLRTTGWLIPALLWGGTAHSLGGFPTVWSSALLVAVVGIGVAQIADAHTERARRSGRGDR